MVLISLIWSIISDTLVYGLLSYFGYNKRQATVDLVSHTWGIRSDRLTPLTTFFSPGT